MKAHDQFSVRRDIEVFWHKSRSVSPLLAVVGFHLTSIHYSQLSNTSPEILAREHFSVKCRFTLFFLCTSPPWASKISTIFTWLCLLAKCRAVFSPYCNIQRQWMRNGYAARNISRLSWSLQQIVLAEQRCRNRGPRGPCPQHHTFSALYNTLVPLQYLLAVNIDPCWNIFLCWSIA